MTDYYLATENNILNSFYGFRHCLLELTLQFMSCVKKIHILVKLDNSSNVQMITIIDRGIMVDVLFLIFVSIFQVFFNKHTLLYHLK